MSTAKLIVVDGLQAVRLPEEYRFKGTEVAIRRAGNAVILEPVEKSEWPPGFFEYFRDSPSEIVRPPQGEMPPAPNFDE